MKIADAMETDFTPLITWESTNHGFSQLRTLRGKNRKRLRAMASCGARAENPLPSDLLDWSFGGYSCSFLEEPDQTLLCLICSRVLREPELTDCCGNHYCASCLKRWLNSSRSCPLCRENDFSTLRDKKTERVVQSLQVKCKNQEQGCIWVGELRDLQSHLKEGCPYGITDCTLGCGDRMQRRGLPDHLQHHCLLRKVECKYCGLEAAYEVIMDEHYELCPKVPVTCPNACSNATFQREDLASHAETCPLEPIHCEFKEIGCEVVVARKDMENHMHDSQGSHQLLTLSALAGLRLALQAQKTETEQLKEELQKSRHEQERLKTLVSATRQISALPSTLVSGQTRLCVMQQHLEADAERSLATPFLPVVLKMDGYQQKKDSRELWVSSPFYAGSFGYKFCLCVYADGCCNGEYTHLSAYVHLMPGEFDDQLDWPIEEEITVELQNQLADSNHWAVDCSFKRTDPLNRRRRVRGDARTRANRGSGTPTFILLAKLQRDALHQNCQYLKNNCLYFSVY